MEQSTYKIGIVQKFRIREFGPIFDVCIPKLNAAVVYTIVKTDQSLKRCLYKI
jgi:hypothetical protein